MPLLMLVDTRGSHGDDGEERREPWLVALLDWFFPWPALIVWLCLASRFADGWVGVALIYAAIALAAWRALRALPSDGLKQSHQ